MSPDDRTRVLPEVGHAAVGTQLSGVYELDERIASGGMGEVYRGHNILTGDAVAIKIVLPELARDQTILSLFRKEASILNHLSHDAVVRYHVFTVDPGIGRPYLAMEYVKGESLFDLMRRGGLPTEDVRKLCHRLASGLSAVHEAGAIHRDLSPDNIILPEGKVERAKIIDFGIARSAGIGGETLIGGKFAGKYNYVSPEQLGLYGGEVSERSDIYSLGLVLAAALRGKPMEMSGSQLEIVEKRRTAPDLSEIDCNLRPLIGAMLQPDPRDRPTSMAEIARMAHAGCVDDIDGANGPGFVPHRSPAHLSRPRPAPAPVSQAVVPKRSTHARKIAIAAVSAMGVLSVAGGAYLSSDFMAWRQAPAAGDDKTRPEAGEGYQSRAAPTGTEYPATPSEEHRDVGEDEDREAAQPSGSGAAQAPSEEASAATQSAEAVGTFQQNAQNEEPAMQDELPKPPVNEAAGDHPREAIAALNPPKPPFLATDGIDDVAERISWLQDYRGGECFYATATAATDKSIEIEGFGTAVEPFHKLLEAFRNEFDLEPDISVRLIGSAQCEATDFLRALGTTAADKPEIVLDRTSVPNGSPVSGRLKMLNGLKSTLLLMDDKGMMFNLDERVVVLSGEATFSVPTGHGAVDQATGAAVPQIIIVVTGASDIQAATFSGPVPAAVALPAILAEIKQKGMEFSATAKYFRLGG
jgi:serine/threonine-protein kinase